MTAYVGPMTDEVRDGLVAAVASLGYERPEYAVNREPDLDAYRVPDAVAEAFSAAQAPEPAPKVSKAKKAAAPAPDPDPDTEQEQ
jgi:hypothetical protein